jgi:hypothetical protein
LNFKQPKVEFLGLFPKLKFTGGSSRKRVLARLAVSAVSQRHCAAALQ